MSSGAFRGRTATEMKTKMKTGNENGHDDGNGGDDDSIKNIPGFTEEDEQMELATLSMDEIAKVQSDLCGFSSLFSNFCNLSQHAVGSNLPLAISSLNDEVAKLPNAETSVYYRAVELCPGEICPERKLLFLEYASGGTKEAARALAEYWRGRLDLFGPDKAFQPMTLAGALKDDVMAMTQRQVVQLMPVTDAAGRAILFFSPSRRKLDDFSIEQELRAVWYLFEVVLENPNLRKNGVVVLCDLRGVERTHFMNGGVTRYARIWRTIDSCLPVDIRGMHCCYPTPVFSHLIFPAAKRLASKSIRLRWKLHNGDENAVLTSLAGFCLTIDRLPAELRGVIRLNMNQWMLNRISLEATRRSLQIVPNGLAMAAASIVAAPAVPPASQLQLALSGSIPVAIHLTAPPSAGMSSQGIPTSNQAATKRNISMTAKKRRTSAASTNASNQRAKKRKGKKETRGRKPEKQMDLAVHVKLSNPDMPHKDALVAAGYNFRRVEGKNDLVDQNGVTLSQRRNNLCRRIRIRNTKLKQNQADEEDGDLVDDGGRDGGRDGDCDDDDDDDDDSETGKKTIEKSRKDSPPHKDESSAAESLLNLSSPTDVKPTAV